MGAVGPRLLSCDYFRLRNSTRWTEHALEYDTPLNNEKK